MLRLVMAAVIALSTSGAAWAQDGQAAPFVDTGVLEHRISPGDTLAIDVFPAKEYSRDALVQPDGSIEMLMIGAVHVAGLTPEQARRALAERLSRYVSHPEVNISIRLFSSRVVTIAGEITASGTYEYKDGMRLLDLLMRAAGPREDASLGKVKIFRKIGGKTTRIEVDMKNILDGDMSGNVELQPLDMIYVPTHVVTRGARWVNNNFVPWATLFTFVVTSILLYRSVKS
jgi:polysaccharide export outer membrane protein